MSNSKIDNYLIEKQDFIYEWVSCGFFYIPNAETRLKIHANEEWSEMIEHCLNENISKQIKNYHIIISNKKMYREVSSDDPMEFDNRYVGWSIKEGGRSAGSVLGEISKIKVFEYKMVK